VHRLAFEPNFALVRANGARDRLDQRRLAGAIVADDRKDFARIEVEIGVIEGGDATVSLDEAAGGENGFL